MVMFGGPPDPMSAAMGPGVQQGLPTQGGAPMDGPQAGPPPGPTPAPPGGGPVQPGPTEMALANQVFQLQHMVMQLQKQIADQARRRVMMQFDFVRDNDGRLVGMNASEGTQ